MTNSVNRPIGPNFGTQKRYNLRYMHDAPSIMPNYGSRSHSSAFVPKSNVSRVLLYDNFTQEEMLKRKLGHIQLEQKRSGRLLDMHKKTFIVRQKKRQKTMQESLTSTDSFLPSLGNSTGGKSSWTYSSSDRTVIGFANAASRPSTMDVAEDIRNKKLPDIETSTRKRHVVFQITDASGFTQVFHTLDDGKLFHDLFPFHTAYDRTTQDPRFQNLKGILVPCQTSRDGYLELSPSYHEKRHIPRPSRLRADPEQDKTYNLET